MTESLLREVGPAFGLGRVLPEEFAALGEGPEELVVKVVPVGEDDDGWVFHVGVAGQGAGVEGHGQALSRPLVVPDYAYSSVSGRSPVPSSCLCCLLPLQLCCPEGLFDGGLDGVKLVVAGHLLDELAAPVVVEDDEVPEQGQEVALTADSFQHRLEFGEVGGARLLVVHGLPGLEPLLPCGQEEPIRAWSPSETIRNSFREKSVGSSFL